MKAKQNNEDKIYVYSSFSCVYSAVAMYSSELRQKLCIQMFITEIVQIRKYWTLEINH